MSLVRYNQEHLWLELAKDNVVLGITGQYQKLLGEIAFVELPEPGSKVEYGQLLCNLESFKKLCSIVSPCSGEVIEVNEDLLSQPELLNADPYKRGWLVKIRYDELPEDMMTAEEYEKHLEGLYYERK